MSKWSKARRARAAANKERWTRRQSVPKPPHMWRIDGPDADGYWWNLTCIGGASCAHTALLGYPCNAIGSKTVGALRRDSDQLVNLDEWPALAALLSNE